MAQFGFELEDIRRLIKLVEQRGLERLRIEEEGRMIEIIGPRVPGVSADTLVEAHAPAALSEDLEEPDAEPDRDEDRIVVISPVVGIFYRSPAPDAPPLVEVGDRVEAGQPVGLIEAMKVFSEVVSDHAGIVVEISARNGALVKQGEPLLYLRAE